MAAFGFAANGTNIVTAGLSTWMIKSKKAGEVGYVSLGTASNMAEGSVTMESLTVKTTRGHEKPYATKIDAAAKILGTSKACLQKLNLISDYGVSSSIIAINGEKFAADMGFGWRFVCQGGYEANRYLEVSADLTVQSSYMPLILVGVTETAADPADYLYGFAPGTIYPAGFQALETRNAGETAWETMGKFQNPAFTATLVTTKESQGRSVGYAVACEISGDLMQTADNIDLMDNLEAGTPDFKATLSEGTYITFADNIGVHWTYSNASDMGDIAKIHVVGSCLLTPAEFVACIS